MFIHRRCAIRPGSLSGGYPSSHDLKQRIRTLHFFRRAISSLATPKYDNRARLSRLWAPTGGIAETETEDAHAKLIRAGYLRQAHSGIFHLLPLGRRVQEKVEALIDRHMSRLGASKLSLSSISSEELWRQSGRLNKSSSELFHFTDRKNVDYLLSPTHEEEITSLVASTIKSYKELPVRLYQISRKYRDELRPRQGLLRSREFVMKDLYTFDLNKQLALDTYHEVRTAYQALFDELKIPYLMAEADSGDIGGDLSHEFHFPTPKGEDHIISCDKCDYVANEELAESRMLQQATEASSWVLSTLSDAASSTIDHSSSIVVGVWRGISKDRISLINVWYPQNLTSSDAEAEVNAYSVKSVIPSLDSGVEDPVSLWAAALQNSVQGSIINVVDGRIPKTFHTALQTNQQEVPQTPAMDVLPKRNPVATVVTQGVQGQPLDLLRIRPGDCCPRCDEGSLHVEKAIELGHTFFLGTKYSEPLQAVVTVPKELASDADSALQKQVKRVSDVQASMQMGCHGIGVSRMIAAVAETLCDDRGLNWPRVMAPYEVVVVPAKGLNDEAAGVYDILNESVATGDIIFDDRNLQFPWKMRDADQAGYPVIVVVGRGWSNKLCEVQCRRLCLKQEVHVQGLASFVKSLLLQL